MASAVIAAIHEEMLRRAEIIAAGTGIFNSVSAETRSAIRAQIDKVNDPSLEQQRDDNARVLVNLTEKVFCVMDKTPDSKDRRWYKVFDAARFINTIFYHMRFTLDDAADLESNIRMLEDTEKKMSGVEDEFQTATTPHLRNIITMAKALL